MIHNFNFDWRFMSRIGLGLVLLFLLILPVLLPIQAQAQQRPTPTATSTVKIPLLIPPRYTLIAPPIQITKSVPTFVVTNVGVLNLTSLPLASDTRMTSADLAYSDQFKASINIQSPSSMLIGESRVITLDVTPELLAQASMVRAELHAIEFESVDDGQPDKTVLENVPVSWIWNIAPKQIGEQEFFLAISYINNQGSVVHWQNITLQIAVLPVPSPTSPWTLTPSLTSAPTWTPVPTNSPVPSSVPTITPTLTFWGKVSDSMATDPAAYLGLLITLLLGLLGVYFQYIRKSGKESDSRKK